MQRWRSLVVALLLLCACDKPSPEPVRLIATVNGHGITRAAFDAEVRSEIERHRRQRQELRPGIEQRIKETVLRRMIEDALVADKARALAVAISAPDLESQVREFGKRFASNEERTEYLTRTGHTEHTLREELRRNLLRDRVVARVVGEVEVGDEEIAGHYRDNTARFTEKEQVRASRIVIGVPDGATDAQRSAARAKARLLHMRAASRGADFAALARELSQGPEAAEGGDMGWIVRGSLPHEFERFAFGAKPGLVARVIETPLGFEVVKVVEKRPARQRSLAEVREAIRRTIAEARLNEKRREALAELHRLARIEQLTPL